MVLLNTIAMVIGCTTIGIIIAAILGAIVLFILLGMNKSTG